MSSLTPRSFEDILLDRIVSALSLYRDEQIALDISADFDVSRDRSHAYASLKKPAVNAWSDENRPTQDTSHRNYAAEMITINLDCIARGLEGLRTSDEMAAARMYYLKEQVRQALRSLRNKNFGFSTSVISAKSFPRWMTFKGEDLMPEATIVGGRWAFDITYAWAGEDIDSLPLEEVSFVMQLSKLGQAPSANAAYAALNFAYPGEEG